MGITNGAKIVAKFGECGHYNRFANSYNVYVDGELISYKGYNHISMVQSNAEEAIAEGSIEYLSHLIGKLKRYLVGKLLKVFVYMDGKIRVNNKRVRKPISLINMYLVRDYFKKACKLHQYTVIELEEGEAELNMYLQRDRESALNVFLTEDSDMLSICYGHKPTFDRDRSEICVEVPVNIDSPSVIDNNCVYSRPNDVHDSCVWVKQNQGVLIMISFDERQMSIGYTVKPFRVLMALCGTDFTEPTLTTTMITSLLRVSEDEKRIVNQLNNICEITAMFLFLGSRYYGRWKVNVLNSECSKSNLADFIDSVDRYLQYIETGDMSKARVIDIDTCSVSHELLLRTYDRNLKFNSVTYHRWCEMNDIHVALNNYKESFKTDLYLDMNKRNANVSATSTTAEHNKISSSPPLKILKRPLMYVERKRLLGALIESPKKKTKKQTKVQTESDVPVQLHKDQQSCLDFMSESLPIIRETHIPVVHCNQTDTEWSLCTEV